MTRTAWKRLRAATLLWERHAPDCPLRAYEDAVLVQTALDALACIGVAVATLEWGERMRVLGESRHPGHLGYHGLAVSAARAAMLGLEER